MASSDTELSLESALRGDEPQPSRALTTEVYPVYGDGMGESFDSLAERSAGWDTSSETPFETYRTTPVYPRVGPTVGWETTGQGSDVAVEPPAIQGDIQSDDTGYDGYGFPESDALAPFEGIAEEPAVSAEDAAGTGRPPSPWQAARSDLSALASPACQAVPDESPIGVYDLRFYLEQGGEDGPVFC